MRAVVCVFNEATSQGQCLKSLPVPVREIPPKCSAPLCATLTCKVALCFVFVVVPIMVASSRFLILLPKGEDPYLLLGEGQSGPLVQEAMLLAVRAARRHDDDDA